jgi:hypothetical protein
MWLDEHGVALWWTVNGLSLLVGVVVLLLVLT